MTAKIENSREGLENNCENICKRVEKKKERIIKPENQQR